MVLRALAIQSEEELRARLEAGARLAKDKWGFKVWDPKTNRWERVSAGLRDVAAALYAEQRRGGGGRRAEGAEGAGVEEDYSYIVGLIRQKIDSRAPILQKWVNDIAWWQHLINDTSARLLPDLLSMLSPDEVDLEHPERTVAAIVRHYAELKSRAREAEAALKRYEAALRIYMDKVRKLEGELRGCVEASNQLGDLYDALAEGCKNTLYYLAYQLPAYLPEDVRLTYRVLLSKVQRIWEQAMKKVPGQGEGVGQAAKA
jgi:hypothetical protein